MVLLDLFHVKHRLISEARQGHGAFPAYCSSLAKAFAIPDPRAMEELRQAVGRLNPTLEPWEVDQFMLKNYAVVLRHVPRLIPPPSTLTERYDGVNNLFRGVKDIVTGTRIA